MRALVAAIVCLVFAVDAARRRRSRAMDDDLSPEIDLDAPEPTEILALPGRKFPLNFASGEFTINVRWRRRLTAEAQARTLSSTTATCVCTCCRASPSC